MSIDTIIVNYNAGETLQQCVKALLMGTEPTRVTIIDNASPDGSAQRLSALYGDNAGIEFRFNSENIGFASAVNTVARGSSADFVLILNPDFILVPEALGKLKTALLKDTRAGLAAPTVLDEKGRVQRATVRRFPKPWKSFVTASGLWRLGNWLPFLRGVDIDTATLAGDVCISEAVSGACMLVRGKALAEVGYLDEGYAMHCEDLDLMYRLAEKGWHCLYVPSATGVHQQGVSSRSRPTWVHFHKHRGMARFYKKFQARASVFPLQLLVYAGIWLRFVILWPLALIRR